MAVLPLGGQGPVRRRQVEVSRAEVGPHEVMVGCQEPPRVRVDACLDALVSPAPLVGVVRPPLVHTTLGVGAPRLVAPPPEPGVYLHTEVPLESVRVGIALPRKGPRRVGPLRVLALRGLAALFLVRRLFLSLRVSVHALVHFREGRPPRRHTGAVE